jgi:tetratricopeptide (TPR) repeat protein
MEFARRGVHLNPDNQRAVTVLGYVLMLAGDCSAALEQTERAILLNPNSIFMLDGLGYLLTLLGDWERGPKLIDKVKQLNPYYSPYVHYALWVDFLRQGEYEKAYLETVNFRSPAMFWEPLMTGAVLGLLERIDEGQAAGKKLLKLKPDFSNEGRVLIAHYIKHPDILERTIEGLRKSGIDVQ